MKDSIMTATTKLFDLFRAPPAKVLAAQELEDAKRQLLKQQAAAEYHAQMSAYFSQTIARLQAYLAEENDKRK